jgi:4-hydroxy-tetrahydrodipicolinate synthase
MSLEGILAIACTPYHDNLSLDYDSLQKEVEFIVASGSQGVAFPIMASEFYALSDEERKKAVELVIKTTDGKLPVCVGVTGVNVNHSLGLAKHAQDAGADVLICMTPLNHSFDKARKIEFFQKMNETISIPLMIQNVAAYGTSPLSIDEAVTLLSECENIRYLKEEVDPTIQRICEAADKGEGIIEGIFGGWGGLQLLDDLRAGANGNLPACQFTDVLGKIYQLWSEGEQQIANDLFIKVLPSIIYESKLGLAFSMNILKKRGIVKNTIVRSHTVHPTGFDVDRMDSYLDELDEWLVKI